MDITRLPISLIEEDKDQPRYQFNQEALEELANSIKEIGLLSPIKVRPIENGRYKIIYGNRRYKASLMLGLSEIPCIIANIEDEVDIYFEQIAENLTREDFSPIEEAEAFDKLMHNERFHSSIKLLASKLGKTESYIKNKCELLKFGPSVKKLIVSGTQIRKDCLTEDQLMPLKDLPIEHRDPLALIVARDELAVTDVKKIAKLFKDKNISPSTKDKLLLKNGSGLIETWSVYEQNRKEKLAREKELEEQRLAALDAQEHQLEAVQKSNGKEIEVSPQVHEVASSSIPYHLNHLSQIYDGQQHASSILSAIEVREDFEKEPLIQIAEQTIEELEQLLQQWKQIRQML